MQCLYMFNFAQKIDDLGLKNITMYQKESLKYILPKSGQNRQKLSS
jgi:hypothetical protein